MMKMAMRPQKKQVGGTYFEWKNGQKGTFKRTPYVQVGYRNYDVMAVGAAGGRSGRAGNEDRGYAWPAGGGGGGSKRVLNDLPSLPLEVAVSTGTKGENGSNSTVSYVYTDPRHGTSSEFRRYAEDGQTGETSSFGSICVALGGRGGVGGEVSGGGVSGNVERITGAEGGLGGFSDGSSSNGSWNNTTKTGEGGTGGRGRVTGGVGPGNGGSGATGPDGYAAPAEGALQNYGGSAGGANIQPFTGSSTPTYFGTAAQAASGGVVVLRIT